MARILDVGCGNRKYPSAIGIDKNPSTQADVVHDLNVYPYPFEESSFDEIYADNIIEHLQDVVATMEELHRISKPNALIKIIVPYFRAKWAYIDPTHKHCFTVESFTYFDPDHNHNTLYNYSKATFKTERIVFNESIRRGLLGRLVTRLANKWPIRYEYYLGHFFPLDDLTFYLRVLK